MTSEARGRSCATVKPWRSWSLKPSPRRPWQVPNISSDLVQSRVYLLTLRLLLLSPARAFRNPSQDPPEPRPVDSRDGVSDRCVQAETQGAENALPERHRTHVWREISRSSAACSLRTALRLTRNLAGNISVKKRAAMIGGKDSSFSGSPNQFRFGIVAGTQKC